MGRAFTFADDYYAAAQCLPEEQRGDFITAIVSYAFTGEEPREDSPIRAMFLLVRGRVDASIKQRNRENTGGRPRKYGGEHERKEEGKKEREYVPAKPTVKTSGFQSTETHEDMPRCPSCGDALYSGHCFKCGVDVSGGAEA